MKTSLLYLILTTCLMLTAHVSQAQTASQKYSATFEGPLDSALVKLSKLEPQESTFTSKGILIKNKYGFQIEEFEKVFPSMVSTKFQLVETNPFVNIGKMSRTKVVETKYIDYASFTPVLVAAIQEQQALILKQQQQIEALQKLLNAE